MPAKKSVKLVGGRPWGFKIAGGYEVNQPIIITKVSIDRNRLFGSIRFEHIPAAAACREGWWWGYTLGLFWCSFLYFDQITVLVIRIH